jgi:apolipoprotein N-acyltransferase
MIQGNIEQREKWDPSQARRIFTTYIAMTRDAVRRGARYVIWPESSTPFMFEEDAVGGQAIRDSRRRWVCRCSSAAIRWSGGPAPHLYNAAFRVTPDRRTAAVYRKIQLVPFGEFIPLQQWVSFVAPLVGGLATFAPATRW